MEPSRSRPILEPLNNAESGYSRPFPISDTMRNDSTTRSNQFNADESDHLRPIPTTEHSSNGHLVHLRQFPISEPATVHVNFQAMESSRQEFERV